MPAVGATHVAGFEHAHDLRSKRTVGDDPGKPSQKAAIHFDILANERRAQFGLQQIRGDQFVERCKPSGQSRRAAFAEGNGDET